MNPRLNEGDDCLSPPGLMINEYCWQLNLNLEFATSAIEVKSRVPSPEHFFFSSFLLQPSISSILFKRHSSPYPRALILLAASSIHAIDWTQSQDFCSQKPSPLLLRTSYPQHQPSSPEHQSTIKHPFHIFLSISRPQPLKCLCLEYFVDSQKLRILLLRGLPGPTSHIEAKACSYWRP